MGDRFGAADIGLRALFLVRASRGIGAAAHSAKKNAAAGRTNGIGGTSEESIDRSAHGPTGRSGASWISVRHCAHGLVRKAAEPVASGPFGGLGSDVDRGMPSAR